MRDYLTLKSGVLGYTDEVDGRHVLINKYLRQPQIARLSSALEVNCLGFCNGHYSIDEISKRLSVARSRIESIIHSWHQETPEMFKSERSREEDFKARVLNVASRMHRQWKATHLQATDNVGYHQNKIINAMDQFDNVETTVSHAFRVRHESLCNRSYGEAFCDKLLAMNLLRPQINVLEIGCGTGYFAKNLLDRLHEKAPDLYSSIHYHMLDISPELQRSQKQYCRKHKSVTSFLLEDISRYDFGHCRFDLILCNEMIADLEIALVNVMNILSREPDSPAERAILKYSLDISANYQGDTDTVAINFGAIKLIEKLKTLLADQGRAIIIEYGALDILPQEVLLKEHKEYSTHFGHLMTVAEHLKLSPGIYTLVDFLGFDVNCSVASKDTFNLLNHYLLPMLGEKQLPKLIYTESMLKNELPSHYQKLRNLHFQPLSQKNIIGPTSFYVLQLTR